MLEIESDTLTHEHFSLEVQSTALIIIDGVFFQFAKTGIARVWQSLFYEWVESGFSQHILVLDRGGTAPKISGVHYREIPYYNYNNSEEDRDLLQQICDEEGAEVFISTYYTTPITTPSVLMIYDMIPEIILNADLNQPEWREKHHAIRYASAYITISHSTARDLLQVCPEVSSQKVKVAHCGVDRTFKPASQDQITQFKSKYGIHRPYFLVVGTGAGQSVSHKNIILFLQAFAKLFTHEAFDIVFTGGGILDPILRTYTIGSTVHLLWLNDTELCIAYSGAIALVYPSKYEGFGMPVAEAMASGCPVITCPNSSLTEVAGDAALFVADDDVNAMAEALCEVQKPNLRDLMIVKGLAQAQRFSWAGMAQITQDIILKETLRPLNLSDINWFVCPSWHGLEESLLCNLTALLRTLALHPTANRTTLLVHTGSFSEGDANLLLSGVLMHLCLEENLDFNVGPQVSIVPSLADLQWQALSQHVSGKILFDPDVTEMIPELSGEHVPAYNLQDLIAELSAEFSG